LEALGGKGMKKGASHSSLKFLLILFVFAGGELNSF